MSNDCMETFKRIVINELNKAVPKNRYNNLNTEEKLVLVHLKTDKQLVIKPAEKRKGIVVLSAAEYHQKMTRLVPDWIHYIKHPKIPVIYYLPKVHKNI